MSGLLRLSRIDLVSQNPEQLAQFYVNAFGCLIQSPNPLPHDVHLNLGRQAIRIKSFEPQGRPYPADVSGANPLFQHFAIVVSDMQKAYERLCSRSDWEAISRAGPERLPETAGAVSVFKFRDPEGHPLELIAFPSGHVPRAWQGPPSADIFLGIDHSAISVADTARSIAFYKKLGLEVSGRSFNEGAEQERLDAIGNVAVEVISLNLSEAPKPHVELLCYRGSVQQKPIVFHPNDIAATRLVFDVQSLSALARIGEEHMDVFLCKSTTGDHEMPWLLLHDPDGHLILLETEG